MHEHLFLHSHGVDEDKVAAHLGCDRQIPDCNYLMVRKNEKRSAKEWAYMVRKLADRMDEKQRRMELEKWIPLSLTGSPEPSRNGRSRQQRRRR